MILEQLIEVIRSYHSVDEVASLPDILGMEAKLIDLHIQTLSGVVNGFSHEDMWEILKSFTYFRLYYERQVEQLC